MPIYLYNTLTRQKEIFTPLRKGQAGFYACGPTVYWHAHLGNMRAYLFEDILRRALEYNCYQVKHVMNFTDVGHLVSDEDTGEDKMEVGAKREGKTAREIADFYINAFKRDAAALNIKKPAVYARATEHIKEQIELIKILEQKGFTYIIEDGVYFDTNKLKDYGLLAKLDIEGLKAGARVEHIAGKKNITDFALWKFSPQDQKRQMEWPSPWSPPRSKEKTKGFPGWHIECSAMARKYLGEQFDIHAGGIDHIPVHHTNEIAQGEAAFGKIPARFWLHGGFLLIDGNKMAKSAGDLLTVEKISARFNPLAFRYLTLTAHYRSPLNLTWESLEAAQSALNNLYEKTRELRKSADVAAWKIKKLGAALRIADKKTQEQIKNERNYAEQFLEAINDDLDTPVAVSVIWKMLGGPSLAPTAKLELLLKFDKVLGLDLDKIKPLAAPTEIKDLIKEREKARAAKDWKKADKLREQIEKRGWLVEDTPEGPKATPANRG